MRMRHVFAFLWERRDFMCDDGFTFEEGVIRALIQLPLLVLTFYWAFVPTFSFWHLSLGGCVVGAAGFIVNRLLLATRKYRYPGVDFDNKRSLTD